jgi:capsular polysaccharide transport system permease protein
MEHKDTVDTRPIQISPPNYKKTFRQLLNGVNKLLILTVIMPTTLAIIYYGFLAADIYISESRFVIRSPQHQTATGLGAIFQGVGVSRALDDSYTVQDYLLSRDALKQIDLTLKVSKSWGSASLDRFSRFGGLDGDNSFEALHRYYLKHISLVHDPASSITTLRVSSFNPDEAKSINLMLLDMSENLVNKLNDRARQDIIRFAAAEVATAEKNAKLAALTLSEYRNKNGVFDPEKQSAIQLQQVSKLQDELISTKTQIVQIKAISKRNPQLKVLQKRVEALQLEISSETSKISGGKQSLSDKSAKFERLSLDRMFSEKQLATALATLEQARNDAQRKQLYIERIVQAGKPDKAMEPKRIRGVIATFLISLIAFGVLTILIAGVREHRD